MKPGLQEEPRVAFAFAACKFYSKWFHRVKSTGMEHVPQDKVAGPLIIVANHTAGIDPALVQTFCKFEVTWMMGSDMMVPMLDPLWKLLALIRVQRNPDGSPSKDIASVRAAVRVLKSKGVIGIFPEGRIAKQGQMHPFHEGVGILVSLTGAPVLPVHIVDTPRCKNAWGSIYTRSHSRVEFLPLVRFAKHQKPDEITEELRKLFAEQVGAEVGVAKKLRWGEPIEMSA
jgi:1-acyl-sn-glycerol-3-phosphate acyltransferase